LVVAEVEPLRLAERAVRLLTHTSLGKKPGVVRTTRGQPDALTVVGAWNGNWYWTLLMALAVVYLPLLFPDGRLPSSRWLPVAVLPGIGTLATVVLGALAETRRERKCLSATFSHFA